MVVLEGDAVLEGDSVRQWRRYPEYRDSGVEWLGKVPAHWCVHRLGHLGQLSTSSVDKKQVEGQSLVKLLNYMDVYSSQHKRIDGSLEFMQVTASPSQLQSANVVRGDVFFTPSSETASDIGHAAVVAETIPGLLFSYHVVRFRPSDFVRSALDLRFSAYAFNARYLRERFSANAVGTTRQVLRLSVFKEAFVALPPSSEQHAIVAFLDRETARIDALVARKERLIELLQEKRTALIAQAVTKGLNADVPMRDSGVEWIGEVPAHWEAGRTKFAATLRTGHTPSRQHPEYWENCTIPWFGLADVWQLRDGRREYVVETKELISEVGLANSAAVLLPKGTVIVSRTASVGFSGILGCDMATTQDFVNWTCGPKLRPEFLLYVFRAMRQEFTRLTMGSTHQTIYMPDVARFTTPIPPVEEQDEIVAFVRREKSRIDSLVGKIREHIARLQEYRTALISAAVTGRIDVREEVAT